MTSSNIPTILGLALDKTGIVEGGGEAMQIDRLHIPLVVKPAVTMSTDQPTKHGMDPRTRVLVVYPPPIAWLLCLETPATWHESRRTTRCCITTVGPLEGTD